MVVVIGVRVTPLARRNVLSVRRRSGRGWEMRAAMHSDWSELQDQKTPTNTSQD